MLNTTKFKNVFLSMLILVSSVRMANATVILAPEEREHNLIELFSSSMSIALLILIFVGILLIIISKLSLKSRNLNLFLRIPILAFLLFILSTIGLFALDVLEHEIYSSDAQKIERLRFWNYSTTGIYLVFGLALLLIYKFFPKKQKQESKVYLWIGGIMTILSTLMLLILFIWNPK